MDRRTVIKALTALPLGVSLAPFARAQGTQTLIEKSIPSSGIRIPAVGMGTWITFDVPDQAEVLAERQAVLETFFAHGGAMVDSSPMYGRAQAVLGHCLNNIADSGNLISTTKVWTQGQGNGRRQIEANLAHWGLERFDVLLVHNLVDWRAHLETLREMKADERLGYLGVTTSHGRRHRDTESIITNEKLDFVQFSYNLANREAERRLLPAAMDNGTAVIINRPFRTGQLFHHVRGKPLPAFAAELGIENWAQYFLKFVISHPAVTVAIPATSRVDHMLENMGALTGPLPGAAERRSMAEYFDSIT